MNGKILIVDDDPDIREAVLLLLTSEDFDAEGCSSGEQAIELIRSGKKFDVIIMDIVMPGMSGTESAKKLRVFTKCPILFLTAKSSDNDKVEAYESGGDDYLSKPFSGIELILRIKALLKRIGHTAEDISVDLNFRKVSKNGIPVFLTDTEFDLLAFLYSHRGVTFSNAELYENVWSEKYLPSSSNTVMVHILNLRKKLEDDFTSPKYIQTIWGKGYCYAKA